MTADPVNGGSVPASHTVEQIDHIEGGFVAVMFALAPTWWERLSVAVIRERVQIGFDLCIDLRQLVLVEGVEGVGLLQRE